MKNANTVTIHGKVQKVRMDRFWFSPASMWLNACWVPRSVVQHGAEVRTEWGEITLPLAKAVELGLAREPLAVGR